MKGVLFDSQVWGLDGHGGWRWVHPIAPPMGSFSSLLTHMVYLLLHMGYLAGSKRVSARPSEPDTMIDTALEATASLTGNYAN